MQTSVFTPLKANALPVEWIDCVQDFTSRLLGRVCGIGSYVSHGGRSIRNTAGYSGGSTRNAASNSNCAIRNTAGYSGRNTRNTARNSNCTICYHTAQLLSGIRESARYLGKCSGYLFHTGPKINTGRSKSTGHCFELIQQSAAPIGHSPGYDGNGCKNFFSNGPYGVR